MLLLFIGLGCRYLDAEACDAGEAEGYSEGYDDGIFGCEEDPSPDRIEQATGGSFGYAASYEACYEIGYHQGYQNGLEVGGTDGGGCR